MRFASSFAPCTVWDHLFHQEPNKSEDPPLAEFKLKNILEGETVILEKLAGILRTSPVKTIHLSLN
jgi:hypothetical protein